MTHEEIGIIKDVGFGMRDAPKPVLWFAVHALSGVSLQVLDATTAIAIIKDHNIYDIKDLDGKPCVVAVDGQSVFFVRMYKP